MDKIIENVASRRYTRTALGISGPQLLNECFDKHSDDVAITYQDTRGAKWPFTGLRQGGNIFAYEVPDRARHFDLDETGDYGRMWLSKQVYSLSCPLTWLPKTSKQFDYESLTFTFPAASERVKLYMGSWHDPSVLPWDSESFCSRCLYYDDELSSSSAPQLFNAHNIGSSGANEYFEEILAQLSLYLADPSSDLLAMYLGNTCDYYEDPVMVRSRWIKSHKDRAKNTPILVPLDFRRQYNVLAKIPSSDTPWAKKGDSLVWRGSSSFGNEKWVQAIRAINRQSLDKVDIKFISDEDDDLNQELLANPLSYKELLQNKYLLALEGNGVADGLQWMLYSDSVVFMPTPTAVSWTMESELVPFYHYVPVAEDLSDLAHVLAWALENDELCRKISRQATEFIERLWMSKQAESDTRDVLKEMMKKYQEFYGSTLGDCPATTSFGFPSPADRAKDDMGSWYEEAPVDSASLCEDIKYFGESDYNPFAGPRLYTTDNLNQIASNVYAEDTLQRLVPHWKNSTAKGEPPLFAMELGDTRGDNQFPVMMKTRKVASRDGNVPIIVPLETYRHYGQISDVEKNDVTWEDKVDTLMWRGSTTGGEGRSRVEKIRSIYRMNFELSPMVKADVGFTDVVQGAQVEDELLKPYMQMGETLSHKYLLSLEGNDIASNLKWLLMSKSVVFMPIPTTTSWGMEHKLVPFVHYIPLAQDLSDLPSKILWAKEHDSFCRQIAEQATEYIERLWASDSARNATVEVSRLIVQRYQQNYGPALRKCPVPSSAQEALA